jgi:hypothetical protein
MIDPDAEQKIEKLLKLALRSDKEGEVLASERAIRRTLDGVGSDIHELAARVNAGLSWSEMAEYCAAHDESRLTAKERDFVADIVRRCACREPSEKQGKWLHVL